MGDTGWKDKVNGILESCRAGGRSQLYEHEIYEEILGLFGIDLPVHHLVRNTDEITASLLSRFGSGRVVVKVVSPKIAHKEKLGGVKVVVKDVDFVRYTFERMRKEIGEAGYPVEGALLVEFVEYSRDLGNEILLGFRQTETFGPVLSFSKGGGDAEHFAAHFSPPNLLLPPIDRKWAMASIAATHISKKYAAEGRTGCVERIVDTKIALGKLCVAFSDFFESESPFVLKEFEINPFVFDAEGRFLPLDGYGVIGDRRAAGEGLSGRAISGETRGLGETRGTGIDSRTGHEGPRNGKDTLDPFFIPDGIAVVGVSATDNAKAGNEIVKNLLELGRDDVFGVNPRGGTAEICGMTVPLHRSVSALPAAVDLAVITVPADAALPVVEDCVNAGVKGILIISGGFSETSKNDELERRILEIAREHGIRIMGPNCLGVVYAGSQRRKGINTFFIPEEKLRINLRNDRNVAILSQSGALGIVEIYNLRNAISPKVIVSYGNQLDIDPCDLVGYFADDPGVDVIGLYIEGFKPGAGRRFFNAASRIKKPIVVYKAGRTEAGMQAAMSHTASMSGEYTVAKAAMKQAGLVVAETMMDHADLIKTFALFHDCGVSGRRTAVITNAGYEKTNAADNIGDLEIAELSEGTKDALRAVLPQFVGIESFLDVTPMVSDEIFVKCAEILIASDTVDCLCISIVPHAGLIHTTDKEMLEYKNNVAAGIVDVAHRHRKPIVVSVTATAGADANYNRFAQTIESGKVPTFLSAERAMMCLNAFVKQRLVKERMLLSEWLR